MRIWYGPGEVEPETEPVYTSSVPCSCRCPEQANPGGRSARVTGLEPPYSPYHYRLVSGNENGKTYGETRRFCPSRCRRWSNRASPGSEPALRDAQRHGQPPSGFPPATIPAYGTTAYGSTPHLQTTTFQAIGPGTPSPAIGGLAPSTTYHYAPIASPGGTSTGPDETFTRSPCRHQPSLRAALGEVALGAATLSGWSTAGLSNGLLLRMFGPSAAYGLALAEPRRLARQPERRAERRDVPAEPAARTPITTVSWRRTPAAPAMAQTRRRHAGISSWSSRKHLC